MSLARRFVVWLLGPYFLLFALNAWVRFDRELSLFDIDMRRDHLTFAKGMGAAVRTVWATRGAELARELVLDADPPFNEVDIHWQALSPGAPGDRFEGDEPLRAELSAGNVAHREMTINDERRFATFYPVEPYQGHRTVLRVSESLASKNRYVRVSLRNSAVFNLAFVLTCALVASAIGAWLVGRPVSELVEQARRVGRGELDARIHPARNDELGMLAVEMNAMAELLADAQRRARDEGAARLAAIEQLRQADRLTTVGRLASGIAHELGTPLNVVGGRATLIAELTAEDESREYARIIVAEVDRMAGIIRQLLDFARHRAPDRFEQDVTPIVRQVFTLLGPIAEKHKVSFELDASGGVPVSVDGGQLQQVLTNLVVNGIQAMHDGGKLEVTLTHGERTPPEGSEALPGAFFTITVHDDGEGIPESVRPRIFEPFFTTKDVGVGTGLGLSVSYGIIRDHGGYIEVESAPGRGSTFHVHLPIR